MPTTIFTRYTREDRNGRMRTIKKQKIEVIIHSGSKAIGTVKFPKITSWSYCGLFSLIKNNDK